jgi:hypothetical protein
MPAKDKIQKTFFLTPAQVKFLKNAGIKNLSEYIRRLIAADQPGFPDDMPQQGGAREGQKEA